MDILCTGNRNYGLAAALGTKIENTFYASRSNGFDLTRNEDVIRLAERSLTVDAFVNCANIPGFGQTRILQAVWDRWVAEGKGGHIVNIGSTADTGIRPGSNLYPIEKQSLRALSRNLSWMVEQTGIRMTYVALGQLATPSMLRKHPDTAKIALDDAAEAIVTILCVRSSLNINEISIDPILVK